MKTLFLIAAELDALLTSLKWRYCFIGGIALQRWGQPRLTNDIDITIMAAFGEEAAYIDQLLSSYDGRIPDARQFALNNRVLLLVSKEGIPIDVALGGIAYEKIVMSRASRYEYLPDLSLLTCSAEDLIILKSFADRPRDWADVETIIIRQHGQLDWGYVFEQLLPLCQIKESPWIMEHLGQLKNNK
ncbi:MAG: hypothetical protein JW787_15975 [Sedimentisphaerales bacterium]|nr:hypothetical protein [Sedimentisphaerales bacterium]